MKTRSDSRLNSRPKQPTPKELTNGLLDLIRRKFYEGDSVAFAKDRSRLLAWVVLWPASWLNSRGVSITTDSYREVFSKVIMEAVIHGTEKVRYRPAWLKQVVQSHFKIHGEEIYNAAKSARSLVETAMLLTGKSAHIQSDPMREMSVARSLISTSIRRKTSPRPSSQPDLFG